MPGLRTRGYDSGEGAVKRDVIETA